VIGHPIQDRASDFRLRLLIGRSPGVPVDRWHDLISDPTPVNAIASLRGRAEHPGRKRERRGSRERHAVSIR
jgi:hypothetical protein